MLRNWRKKAQAKRLGTPIYNAKKGTYLVPTTTYVRADGEIRHEIDATSIMLAMIADDLGTDDPYAVLRERTRREVAVAVRRFCEAEDGARPTPAVAGPLLPPVYHKQGEIIPFPRKTPRKVGSQPETMLVPHSESLTTAGNLAEEQLAEAERIATAIEEVLKTARSEEERELYRQFLSEHEDLARSVIDDHARLSLCIHEGRVRAHYTRYVDRAVCQA